MVNSNLGNRGYVSDDADDDGLYPIHGIAIGNNDITIGQKSGEAKLWRPSVLEEAADTLEDKHIVVNHENRDAYEVIGEIEEAKYDEEKGVIYRGVIDSEDLARKIEHGWLEVSPRILHSKDHEMVQDVKVPESIRKFDNLSIVRKGAAGSNEVELGNVDELSVEELQESFEDEESEDEISEYQSTGLEELAEGDFNYAQWMYKTREGAEGAAQKFKCGGSHEHTVNGEKWYMPCSDHDTFLQNVKDDQAENMSLVEGDFVETPSGKGEIVELSDSGVYEGSIENERVRAEEDDPAVLIEEYEEDDDDWIPTDKKVGYNYSELSEWEKVEDDEEVEEMQTPREEKKRLAGQISSWALLTREEAVDLLETLDPDSQTSPQSLKISIARAFDGVNEEDVDKAFEMLQLGSREAEEDNGDIGSIQLEDSEDVDENEEVEQFTELSKVLR